MNVKIAYRSVNAVVKTINLLSEVLTTLICGIATSTLSVSNALAENGPLFSVSEIAVPAVDGAREPTLATMADGRALLTWTEPLGQNFAVKVAISDGTEWGAAQTVVAGNDLFVNWADFPSAIALSDGTLVAHWLQINGEAYYQYDTKIALSKDYGRTWSEPFILHDDRSQREHGFVTLLPTDVDAFTAIWLDGRYYDAYGPQEVAENAMQLRARRITSGGDVSEETLLDMRTCTCCQTSAVVANNNDILAVYRDRSIDEIRDISIVRSGPVGWSTPKTVSFDGWQIEGCPVNGPAIDAADGQVVVAWFTAAHDIPKVKVAFSSDDGNTFGTAFEISGSAPSGRVDALQQPDGTSLVTWVEQTPKGETLQICLVDPKAGCKHPQVLAANPRGRTVGFPRMARVGQGAVVAWAEPSSRPPTHPEGGTTVRTVLVQLKGLN